MNERRLLQRTTLGAEWARVYSIEPSLPSSRWRLLSSLRAALPVMTTHSARVFHWPKDMAAVFDLAKTRIGNKRDQVEDALRERVDKFEGKVNKASKDLDLFMRKDPPVLTMDEMRTSSSTIDK